MLTTVLSKRLGGATSMHLLDHLQHTFGARPGDGLWWLGKISRPASTTRKRAVRFSDDS